jgi:hypothetical protein
MEALQKTRLFSILLALFFIGCGNVDNTTIFDIHENPERPWSSQIVSLFPVPVHREYHESATFAKTEDHLSVFAVYNNGNTQKLSLGETQLTLEETLLADGVPYFFKSPGEKVVALSYGTLNAQYTIIVRSSTENPGGTNPNTPQGGTTIDIEIKWD